MATRSKRPTNPFVEEDNVYGARYMASIMEEMKNETNDRSMAIVGGAMVDNALESFLLSRATVRSELKKMFEYGPLCAHGARIQIAYAMGLIGPKYYKELIAIKDIRNIFAHDTHEPDAGQGVSRVSFNSANIMAICDNLHFHYLPKLMNLHKGKSKEEFAEEDIPPPPTYRDSYMVSCAFITGWMYMASKRPDSNLMY